MKILNPLQVKIADNFTIENEPITSIELMERASKACVDWLIKQFNLHNKFFIVCGLGNNGGDGLAIARLLQEAGYFVHVTILRYSDITTDDFLFNEKRLMKTKSISVHNISDASSFKTTVEETNPDAVIIDAIFGSGINKPIDGWVSDVIQTINALNVKRVSIDMPSGLFFEDNILNNKQNIIRADYTLSFETPKLVFMFSDFAEFVGNWLLVDIGWLPDATNNCIVQNNFIDGDLIQQIIHSRGKFSNKGNYGHAILFSGAFGKMGASVLSAKSCLRSGVGLLTVHIPNCGYGILQQAVPEAMVSVDKNDLFISEIPNLINYSAIGIGPGIGLDDKTQNAFKLLIQESRSPMVIDADALNILAENKTWLAFLPPNSILTPHPKELERLIGKTSSSYDQWNACKKFSEKFNIIVIIKGAHTKIVCPDGTTFFNSTGNPGMATAGSGDVLTGIILGLIAQGYSARDASILGVYIHGLAGDIALESQSYESLIASDIIKYLGKAYKLICN